ncbi:D-methionine transport system substrate-binding protein [Sporomusaceae bacterium BoRhaA]|uniref:MetQ/NlpA family ABC transporter substrate-binding protein n=1 Tax=Pelorhabdus rhamnosifermentans TaxID=2772457 RepID=UPI001C061AF2|nr:MetQ/NlpA family ABC transporter substrate-binding protein [Pelorhabdus rhamnosifermentans]MBU2702625.1 D-methionine transport system substrate-binding protein [Pelorhabdus rhamnosifermentans]
MKKLIQFLTTSLLVVFSLTLLAGCGSQSTAPENKVIKVGVTAGPHAEIMDEVKKLAEKQGLKIEVVEFNDYIQPNVALNQGDIDLNSFQHEPYLKNIVKDRGFDIVSIGKGVIFPMGIYSKKVKDLNQVADGGTIAIPNDPTNGGRALLLLQQKGLLKLKEGAGLTASADDIAENPKHLNIKELDAAQIPRSLDDIDAAAINTNYALTAGLNPVKDSIALESGESPYANIIAARGQDKDNPAYLKLVEIYHSDQIKAFIQEHFKGSVIAGW